MRAFDRTIVLRAKGLVVAALVLLVATCALSLHAEHALAFYNESADSYPATQDLGAYDAPIYGDQLPDGAYKVTARTTSRMCILYTDPANADARESKEQAIVTVSGGSMTAVFYISKAYTHLYMGTDVEAAALGGDGTDASAYIPGDPAEGYVPHLFAIPISALNVPITFAAYSGGDKGVEKGKWYTREVVFGMTEAEFLAATATSENPEQGQEENVDPGQEENVDPGQEENVDPGQEENVDPGQEENVDPGQEESVDPGQEESVDPGQEESVDSGQEENVDSGQEENVDSEEDSINTEEEGQSSVALSADNVTTSDSGDGSSGESGGGLGGSDDSQADDGSGDIPNSRTVSSALGSDADSTIGVRFRLAKSQVVIDVDTDELEPVEEPEKPLLTLGQIVVLAIMAIFGAGIIARVILFLKGYESFSGLPAG